MSNLEEMFEVFEGDFEWWYFVLEAASEGAFEVFEVQCA